MKHLLLAAAMACAVGGAGADDKPAAPTLRQKLGWMAASQFESPSWEPIVFGHVGLIFDNRDEPRDLEIVALKKQAEANTKDDVCRRRMSALFEMGSKSDKSLKWSKEAQDICRRRLEAAPDDARTLAWLAIDLRGTAEGEDLATRATKAGPQLWEPWVALAQNEAERVKKMCFEGLGNLPASGVDFSRLEEGLRRQASSSERSNEIIALAEQALAHSRRAIELAPVGETEPFLRGVATHLPMAVVIRGLHMFRGEPAPTLAEQNNVTLLLLQKGIPICRDRPEALGLLGLLSFINVLNALPLLPDGTRDPQLLERRQNEVLGTIMLRLRELCDHRDADVAASACESYAALVVFVQGMGGHFIPSSDLPSLLDKAIGQSPQRCLAWELRISVALTSAPDPVAGSKEAQELTLKRLKILPTARSHALVGHYRVEGAAPHWRSAVETEPGNVVYRLNLAAALLRDNPGEKELAECLMEIQTATEAGYANGTWRNNPKLDSFRQRIFVLHQALAGNMSTAKVAVISLLKQQPQDAAAAQIQELLEQLP